MCEGSRSNGNQNSFDPRPSTVATKQAHQLVRPKLLADSLSACEELWVIRSNLHDCAFMISSRRLLVRGNCCLPAAPGPTESPLALKYSTCPEGCSARRFAVSKSTNLAPRDTKSADQLGDSQPRFKHYEEE